LFAIAELHDVYRPRSARQLFARKIRPNFKVLSRRSRQIRLAAPTQTLYGKHYRKPLQ